MPRGRTCRWRRIRAIAISLGVGLVFSVVVGLVGADGTHVFMVKMNYWLGL